MHGGSEYNIICVIIFTGCKIKLAALTSGELAGDALWYM